MKKALIYFTAAWCAPCRQFGPVLAKEAEARGLSVIKVDIDNDPAGVAAFHNVTSVPTVVAVIDGAPVDRFNALPPLRVRDRLDVLAGA